MTDVDKLISTMSPVQKDGLISFSAAGSWNSAHGAVKKALYHRCLWDHDQYGNPILTTLGTTVLALLKLKDTE